MITYGKLYERNLSEKQIAALVRKKIEALRRAGHLPAGKYSVRIGGSNVHSTIDVRISELAGEVFDRAFLVLGADQHFANCRAAGIPIFRHTSEVRAAVARVEGMLAAYNFEDTGSLSNVNFFASIEVLADENAARAALIAQRDVQMKQDREEVRAEMRRQDAIKKLRLSRKEREYLLTWTLQEGQASDAFAGIDDLEAKLEGRGPVELNREEAEVLIRWTSVPDGPEDFPGVDQADLLRRITEYRDALPSAPAGTTATVVSSPAGVAPVLPAISPATMEKINAKLEQTPAPSNVVFLSPPCRHFSPPLDLGALPPEMAERAAMLEESKPGNDQVSFLRFLGAL